MIFLQALYGGAVEYVLARTVGNTSVASNASRIPISVVVMTKNEERNVLKCLRSVERFGEVFVVDSGSSDQTQDLARKAGATVVDFNWNGQYPKKKQWCLDNLPFTHDWVMYLDADEEVLAATAIEIAERVRTEPHAGYFASYEYVFLGSPLRYGRLVSKLVLLDRRRSYFPVQDDLAAENMWEVEGHYQPIVDGSTAHLVGRLVHDDHDDLFHFFERHNRYSDWEAVGHRTADFANRSGQWWERWLRDLAPRLPGRALATFIYCYLLKQGFRDGRAGFHYAIAMAFYVWQIDLKIYEIASRGVGSG